MILSSIPYEGLDNCVAIVTFDYIFLTEISVFGKNITEAMLYSCCILSDGT